MKPASIIHSTKLTNEAARCCCVVTLMGLMLAGLSLQSIAAENDTETAPPTRTNETNSEEVLRSYLQLQEQIHATRLAVERNREEADAAAARNAEALANRLQAIEVSLTSQRNGELQALQSSNHLMLIVAGSVAGVGFLAMLLVAYSHWRALSRLAEIARVLPGSPPHATGRAVAALGPGDDQHLVTLGSAEQSNGRLLGALERLEKRIYELEHTAQPPLSNGTPPPTNSEPAAGLSSANEGLSGTPVGAVTQSEEVPKVSSLLGKGQSLLNLDHAEEALACFDQVLALEPNHPEALVKKGTALERMRKLSEAIECYDRAIAADASLTIAYLYKGGLFNRMERFTEALECYEQALRTQEKQRV